MQKLTDISPGVFLIAITLSFLRSGNIFLNETASCYALLFTGAVFAGWLAFQIFRTDSTEKRSFTLIDLAFLLFLSWIILNSFLVKEGAVDPFLRHKLGAVAGFYLLVRLTGEKGFLLYSIVISGTIQAVISIAQSFGVLSSNHLMFDVTGSLGNPGQLGGYLAVCLTVSLCLLIAGFRERKIITSCILLAASLLQGVGLYLSDSRAGWVGLFAGLTAGILMARKGKSTNARAEKPGRKFLPSRTRAFALCATLLFFAAAITLLYHYRPKSADARLLAWRVCCDMIADHPLTGHGAGAFDEKYMLYQAAFFEKYPESPFAPVAGNAGYPFNELLNALISFGMIGAVLLLLMLWAVFWARSSTGSSTLFKAGLSSWLAFSMFSYPAEVFPLLLLGIACLGGIEGGIRIKRSKQNGFTGWMQTVKNGKIRRGVYGVFIAVIAVILLRAGQDAAELRLLSRKLTAPYLNTDELEPSYYKMKFNSAFNNYYMERLKSQPDNKVEDVLPSSEGYCMKGNYYLSIGDTLQAEQAFYTASNMVPALIRPKYSLWKLYVEKGDTAAAKEMAEKILNSPLKTESIYTLKVKKEVREKMKE